MGVGGRAKKGERKERCSELAARGGYVPTPRASACSSGCREESLKRPSLPEKKFPSRTHPLQQSTTATNTLFFLFIYNLEFHRDHSPQSFFFLRQVASSSFKVLPPVHPLAPIASTEPGQHFKNTSKLPVIYGKTCFDDISGMFSCATWSSSFRL